MILHPSTEGPASVSSTQEHAAFLDEHLFLIRLADEKKLGGALAGRTPEGILINKQEFERMRKQLLERGVAEDKVDRILRLKLLPVISHEVRHAMNGEELFERTGRRYHFPTKEDEVTAFADGARVLRELQDSGDADVRLAYSRGLRNRVDSETYRDLLEADAGSLDGIKKLVNEHYKGTPAVLELKDGDLIEAYGAWAESGRKKLSMSALTRNQLRIASSAVEIYQMRGVLAELGPENRIAREIEAAEEAMGFFKDPARGRKMREFYREKLQAIEKPS